jgi:hypothetical protein
VAAGSLTRDRADAFVADQVRRQANGSFLVATPLYCATAAKAAETTGRHRTR